jgi:ribosomal protein L30/L7E
MLFLSSIKAIPKTLEIRGIIYGRINKIVYCLDTLQIKGMIKPPNKLVSVSKCKSEVLEKCKNLGIKVSSYNPKKMEVDWSNVIKTNNYINEKETEKVSKDKHSFCSLIDTPLSQSQNIKLGICMEKLFEDIVSKNTEWKNINEGNKKGEHQTDHLWGSGNRIVYVEQKNNINLDTEKTIKTESKVKEVIEKYSGDYKVEGYILATRYLSVEEDIAKTIIKTKYKNIPVIGVNEYLKLFGLKPIDTYDTYKSIINDVIKTKFTVTNF